MEVDGKIIDLLPYQLNTQLYTCAVLSEVLYNLFEDCLHELKTRGFKTNVNVNLEIKKIYSQAYALKQTLLRRTNRSTKPIQENLTYFVVDMYIEIFKIFTNVYMECSKTGISDIKLLYKTLLTFPNSKIFYPKEIDWDSAQAAYYEAVQAVKKSNENDNK